MSVKIKFGMKRIINQGNYENVQIESSIEMDCEEKEVPDIQKKISNFVNKVVEKEGAKWEK